MKKIAYILFVILLSGKLENVIAQNMSSVSQATCYSNANAYGFIHNTHFYNIIKEAKTWTVAAACAAADGGFLVEINDQAEQTAVYNAIISSGIASNYSPVGDGGGASYIWLGGNDKFTEGSWFWDGDNNLIGSPFWTGQGAAGAGTGSVVNSSFVNWGGKSTATIQEPDDFASNQDAVAMALGSWPYGIAGEWNDIAETNSIYYIIEYNTIPTSVKKNSQAQNVKIFFDGSSNKLKIENAEANFKISIIDMQGKIVSEIVSNDVKDNSVDLNKLNSGIYLVKYYSTTGNLNYIKIIK